MLLSTCVSYLPPPVVRSCDITGSLPHPPVLVGVALEGRPVDLGMKEEVAGASNGLKIPRQVN